MLCEADDTDNWFENLCDTLFSKRHTFWVIHTVGSGSRVFAVFFPYSYLFSIITLLPKKKNQMWVYIAM